MKAILPFKINYTPITKLALINFEKDPDEIYCGLELQYIEGVPYGKGYRVIAYRNDKYVDVYDDTALAVVENENFDVAQKGLKTHVHVQMKNLIFQKNQGKVEMSFSFKDLMGRIIEVELKEKTKRKSKAMNLLAPIGVGTENPTILPVFYLYDFDFVRKARTDALVKIDGKPRKLDNFPFPIPLNGQWRYYTRYTMDCQIIEFIPSEQGILHEVELNTKLCHIEGQLKYQFEAVGSDFALSEIEVLETAHPIKVVFQPSLSFATHEGTFHIIPEKRMGSINGGYSVEKVGQTLRIYMSPKEGWTSIPNSLTTKMILSKNSMFCTWSKKYSYEQQINLETNYSESRWSKV